VASSVSFTSLVTWKSARAFSVTLVRALLRHNVIDLGAQLAYWSLLAVFPFIIFLLTVVGYLPLGDVDSELMNWLAPFMPEAALKLIWETVHEIVGRQRGGLLALSLVTALWSAAGGASALTVALNRAYGVEETRPYWRRKGQALLATLTAVLLLLVVVVCAAIGTDLATWGLTLLGAGHHYEWLEHAWGWLRWVATLVALVGVLAAAYSLLPNTKHGFSLISVGSVVAVVAWALVTWGFRHFVAYFGSYARSYGALGAVIMLLTWIYLSGITIIVGAEVNAVLVRMRADREHGDPMT
jgi:membrane protein